MKEGILPFEMQGHPLIVSEGVSCCPTVLNFKTIYICSEGGCQHFSNKFKNQAKLGIFPKVLRLKESFFRK